MRVGAGGLPPRPSRLPPHSAARGRGGGMPGAGCLTLTQPPAWKQPHPACARLPRAAAVRCPPALTPLPPPRPRLCVPVASAGSVPGSVDIVVAPSFVHLDMVKKALRPPFQIAAQVR